MFENKSLLYNDVSLCQHILGLQGLYLIRFAKLRPFLRFLSIYPIKWGFVKISKFLWKELSYCHEFYSFTARWTLVLSTMNSFILTSQSFKDLHYQVEKIKGLKKFWVCGKNSVALKIRLNEYCVKVRMNTWCSI